MTCTHCRTKPVINLPNSNIFLCSRCFIKYFERKVIHTILKYKLIEKNDIIVTAVSGGKDSFVMLEILNKLSKKRPFTLKAITIDEGIKKYRETQIKNTEKYCKENKIEFHKYSFKKEFSKTQDQIVKKVKTHPCSYCGVLRRMLLNKKARELKATKLATGHNLDDEAQSIIMNQFRRNIKTSARLGPITGVIQDKKFIRRIKPLYFLTENEVSKYAETQKLPHKKSICPYRIVSYRCSVVNMLNDFEKKYPGTKHNIISSFLEILPLLKKEYTGNLKYCKKCKEPCSSEICNVCKTLDKLKL